MLAEKHLMRLGVTVQQAKEFIDANIEHSQIIFAAASRYGVTTRMLSEISEYPTSTISDYFATNGINSKKELDVSILVNSDLGLLENLISFNEREGNLSNTALRDLVKPQIIAKRYEYDSFFTSPHPDQPLDGVYSSGELGVENLDNVPATNDSIESLFYGSLINMFLALDQSELDQINAFPNDRNSDEFQILLLTSLNETPDQIAWNDEQLVSLVANDAVNILEKFWNNDALGVLDHSYMGLATGY